MNTCTVQPDQRVFAVYAGLTAGGYDIAQIDPGDEIAAVVHAILEAPWPAHVLDYFRNARAATCEANPYWPRAYMLVAAVMELSLACSRGYPDPVRVRGIMEAMPVDPAHRDPATIEWLMGLPAVIRQVTTEPWFEFLWTSYADVVAPIIPLYQAEEGSPCRIGIPAGCKLVIIPNPLQARQIADGVVAQDATYLILARPDFGSIVHEALHSLFAPVRDSMIRMGYAWDDSPASWRRVWEESLVRAAAIWAECGDCPAEAARAAADRHGVHLCSQAARVFCRLLERAQRCRRVHPGMPEGVRRDCSSSMSTQRRQPRKIRDSGGYAEDRMPAM